MATACCPFRESSRRACRDIAACFRCWACSLLPRRNRSIGDHFLLVFRRCSCLDCLLPASLVLSVYGTKKKSPLRSQQLSRRHRLQRELGRASRWNARSTHAPGTLVGVGPGKIRSFVRGGEEGGYGRASEQADFSVGLRILQKSFADYPGLQGASEFNPPLVVNQPIDLGEE